MQTVLLPHWVPNAGLRLEAGGQVLAYTGDSGPEPGWPNSPAAPTSSWPRRPSPTTVPEKQRAGLSTAASVGRQAAAAGVRRLVLTHLFPTTDPAAARTAAAASYGGPIDIAAPGLAVDVAGPGLTLTAQAKRTSAQTGR